MRTNVKRFGRRGWPRFASGRTGGRLAPLAGKLGRALERRVAEATGRGGRGMSAGDLSAAVVDISRLAAASARLAKLDRPEPEAAQDPGEALDEIVRRLTYEKEGGAASAAAPASADPHGGGRS